MANDLEHVGGRGLLLQGFTQLVEQPRVLDRDDGLVGEVLDQLDLLVGKGPHLLAVENDGAFDLIILDYRHSEYGADMPNFDSGNRQRIALGIASRGGDISDLDDLFRTGNTPDNGLWSEPRLLNNFSIGRHVTLECHDLPVIALVPMHEAESGFANSHRIYQHRIEDRFKLAGRTRDDLQHLRRRRLLLQ